jgi:hypothetical protein
LAIVSKILSRWTRFSIAEKRAGRCPDWAIVLSHVIDAAGYQERLQAAVAGNNLRRQCSKKRGGRIAPAAIAALIEGGCCSVNALKPRKRPEKRAVGGP